MTAANHRKPSLERRACHPCHAPAVLHACREGSGGAHADMPFASGAPRARPRASVEGCEHNAVLLCTSIHLTAHASALPQDVQHLAGCGRLFRLFANIGSVPHADCDICTVHVLPPLDASDQTLPPPCPAMPEKPQCLRMSPAAQNIGIAWQPHAKAHIPHQRAARAVQF